MKTDLEKVKGLFEEIGIDYGEWVPFSRDAYPRVKLDRISNTELLFAPDGKYISTEVRSV